MAAGTLISVLLGACAGSTPAATATAAPSQTAAPRPIATPARQPNFWPLDLHATGGFTTSFITTDPQGGGHTSVCSGTQTAAGTSYRLLLWVVKAPEHLSLTIEAPGYKGPGDYSQSVTAVMVAPITNQRWASGAGDPVAFSVAAGQETGSMDVTMSNVLTPDRAKLAIKGSWSCVTGEKENL